MESFIAPIINYLELWAQKVPLEVFAVVGSFLEEVLAPIPSPFVMALAGSITAAQNKPLIYIFLITVLGAIGKVFGAWVLYFGADKAEDIIFGKLGKFLGVTHSNVEKIGEKFKGNWKDILTLTFLRSIPVLLSSVVSVTCGFIKLNIKTYLIGTFLGTLIRNLFFLYLGYTGLIASKSVATGIDSAETAGKIIVVVLMVIGLAVFYIKRNKKSKKEETIEEAKNLLEYKDTPPLPKEESDSLPTLYIFRHGQTEDNRDFIFSGWRDSPLTEEGREQALVLAKKLENKKLDILISSPQIRAVDTMKLGVSLNENAKNKPIETDDRIKERSYGDYQGKSKMDIQLSDPKLLEKIRRGYNYATPNGESIGDVCKRVASFCDYIVGRMKKEKVNVAVSCHGNSIRGFRQYFERLTPEEVEKIETPLGQDYVSYVIK